MMGSRLTKIVRGVSICVVLLGPTVLLAAPPQRLIDWRVSLDDRDYFSNPEFDDSSWPIVQLPANLEADSEIDPRWQNGEAVAWLRATVRTQPGEENLALVLGQVSDLDRVYFDGVLIGRSESRHAVPIGYSLSRIYPIPGDLLRGGEEHVLAIRVVGRFPGSSLGIVSEPVAIQSLAEAQRTHWTRQRNLLVFAAVYLVTGVFFMILWRRLRDFKEYFWFGVFSIGFALQQFLVNEVRFSLGAEETGIGFLIYKLFEQFCYILLPVIYYFFFIHFFKVDKLGFGWNARRFGLIYALVNGVVCVAFTIVMDPYIWYRILSLWFWTNLPLYAFYLWHMVRKSVRHLDRDAIILSIATLIMFLVTVHFWAVGQGFLEGPAYFSWGVLAFYLILAFALVFRLIELQMDVESRGKRLDTVNVLRDRVFQYLTSYLRKPTESVTTRSRELLLNGASDQRQLANLGSEIEGLQNNLDDVLELSRLEVISQPEFVETVNFRDFITAVIPRGEITHYIKVNPSTLLNTSLELVNSFVIRLIDFPAFREFEHIDLIITSDLDGHVHFRFTLLHTNIRKTRQLFEVLTGKEGDEKTGHLWIKWAIIREIIRIIGGHLKVSMLNRKFLNIDIELEAHVPDDASDFHFDGQLRVAGGGDVVDATTAVAEPVEAVPRFHSQMTLTEFGQFIRHKLRRKG